MMTKTYVCGSVEDGADVDDGLSTETPRNTLPTTVKENGILEEFLDRCGILCSKSQFESDLSSVGLTVHSC